MISAAVIVGGQLALAGLLSTIRRLAESAPRAVARAFARLQRPAYAVVVGTGFWEVAAIHVDTATHGWIVALSGKIAVALLAGLFAYLHQRARSCARLAAYGGLAGDVSPLALVLAVLLDS